MKGRVWEALVFYVNREKTSEIQKLAANAQWFEDRTCRGSRVSQGQRAGHHRQRHRRRHRNRRLGPVTPVGINLPNDQTVRERYGSKSVSLSNVNERSTSRRCPVSAASCSWSPEEAERTTKWSAMAGDLLTTCTR
jgi:dipeptidyl-peptidase-3